MIDYNLALGGLIAFFLLADMLAWLAPGEGVLQLGPGRPLLRFPSPRSRFHRRMALMTGPLAAWWPSVPVSMLAAGRAGSVADMRSRLARHRGLYRWLRPLLALLTLLLLAGIAALLLRLDGGALLRLLLAAYLLYLAGVAGAYVLLGRGAQEARPRCLRLMLEPLLCIPYAPQLPRKLGQLLFPALPLMDLLESDFPLSSDNLEDLAGILEEYREMVDDDGDRRRIERMIALAQAGAQRMDS
ncbi:hypothetical protein [Chromobacterium subtsugae]|uniref:hypothetical protein n=1 Tax=Chromobacterium subtsugae TaxID=251747 RepID=UPI000640CCA0|nr:hypothetical protein [Chromobacterium subtsugae]